jgi:hypothetical protein
MRKKSNIRVILIDPFAEQVKEMMIQNDLSTIYQTLGCELITITSMVGKDYRLDLILDDEGLLKDPENQKYFKYKLFSQPFAGRGLLTSSDRDGNCASVPSHVRVEDIEKDIIWYKPDQNELDSTMEIKVMPI